MVLRGKGRPSLGITRKVSITLSPEAWVWIDGRLPSRSEVIREAVALAMEGQVDIYQAIKKAQEVGRDEIKR